MSAVPQEGAGVLEKQSADSASPGRSETFGVTCPDCGGSIRVREGEKSVRCQYCGSALYVTKPKGVRRYYISPRITAGKARLEALHFLSDRTAGRVKARHASIVDINLINVPFWRMNGRLVGWVCGEKIYRKDVEVSPQGQHGLPARFKTVEERVPYSRLVFKDVDWSTPACTLRHLGLQGISLKAQLLDWDVFDHSLKKKLNIALPMKTRREAEQDGFRYLSSLTTPGGSTVKANRFRLFDNDFSIYYYPVYIMRYRHGGRIYSITVDGNDGNVIRGDYPLRKPPDYRSAFFVPAFAALLASAWPPLLAIAAACVYLFDLIHQGRIIPLHSWLFGRLESWFGGEL